MKEVIVLGAGPGGYVAAIKAAKLRAQVKLIEKGEVGGTCLNRGCIPTKAMLHVLSLYEATKRGKAMGLEADNVKINFEKFCTYRDDVVKRLRQGIQFLLRKNNVELIKGEGRLTGHGEVTVNGNKLQGRVILATGSSPSRPSFFSFDKEYILNSDDILALKKIPASLLIIGAGAIGVEFAAIFNSLGTKVILIEMLPRIIPAEDEEIAQILAKEMGKKGIIIKTGAKVENIKVLKEKGVKIKVSSGEEVFVEKVLVAVGRTPNIAGMGFEDAGVKIENGKIDVNSRLETNIPDVFAIGDITIGPLLAHKASSQAITAAVNAAGGNEEFLMGDIIPACIYSFPEVARVGLTEKEAKAAGHKTKIGKFPFRGLGKAQAISQVEGMAKVIVNSETEEILGVHIIGPHATELIGEVSLARRMEATCNDIATTCHPHPTLSEVLMEACHAVYGQSIHLP
ncbi:MAG: dihydrolipoyl dehydrogenase [Candidatus Omnitrophica bacterium]|nr:dihydrolipoyl dehydrogenase [Candidatus Omnitrophota bacterium]